MKIQHIKSIHTLADYNAAISRIGELWNSKEGTAKASELSDLVDLVVVYENQHWPIDPPTDEQAREFCREQYSFNFTAK